MLLTVPGLTLMVAFLTERQRAFNSGELQVVIVPIVKADGDREAVLAAVRALHGAATAAGLRSRLDDDESRTPGWKFNFWEMKVGTFGYRVTFCF